MNKANLVGRITADPQIVTNDGKPRVRFTVALRRKNSPNSENSIDYVSCVALGHDAEFIARHFQRGDNISIVGEIRTNKHVHDGETIYSTSILVDEVSYIRSNDEFKSNGRGCS